jgi:protoheme IX farnesyltransferase
MMAAAPGLTSRAGLRTPPAPSMWRDLVTLTKPRITLTVVLTALGGFWLARRYHAVEPSVATLAWMLVGSALVVGGANTLNMYLERDTDGLMARTRNRPLPSGRLSPALALAFGFLLSALALPALTFGVNAVTGLLGGIALVSYVLLYTPLKRRSTLALIIGSVPGAIPPLFGWTAVAGQIEWPALALFGVLFLWQIPHSLAIFMFRREDYACAGLKILPEKRGERVTQLHMFGYLVALVAVTFALTPLSGPVYLATAVVLGAGFIGLGLMGFRAASNARWAKKVFVASLFYLVFIIAALMVGA